MKENEKIFFIWRRGTEGAEGCENTYVRFFGLV